MSHCFGVYTMQPIGLNVDVSQDCLPLNVASDTILRGEPNGQFAPFVFSKLRSDRLSPVGKIFAKAMLHALYIIAFAILSVLAVGNLIRNIMMLGTDARRGPRQRYSGSNSASSNRSAPHPELLDEKGHVVEEPLLVMKSISLEDAREQLDALYDNSSNANDGRSDEE